MGGEDQRARRAHLETLEYRYALADQRFRFLEQRLQRTLRLIKRGDADAVIAGSTEACVIPLILAGFSGFTTTGLGIAMVFSPAQQIKSLLSYEIWMFGGTLFFIGLAAFFFFVYGRRKAARKLAAAPAL